MKTKPFKNPYPEWDFVREDETHYFERSGNSWSKKTIAEFDKENRHRKWLEKKYYSGDRVLGEYVSLRGKGKWQNRVSWPPAVNCRIVGKRMYRGKVVGLYVNYRHSSKWFS
jgi:hypothetical protein